MVEIIEYSKERKYKKACDCGCRFSYQAEDIINERFIICPECQIELEHSKD